MISFVFPTLNAYTIAMDCIYVLGDLQREVSSLPLAQQAGAGYLETAFAQSCLQESSGFRGLPASGCSGILQDAGRVEPAVVATPHSHHLAITSFQYLQMQARARVYCFLI